jgi:hypothetical protein
MEVVPGIFHQGFNAGRRMENHQPFPGLFFNGLETPHPLVFKQFLGVSTGEGLDHTEKVLRIAYYVKQVKEKHW